jgi:hypothetical protein
MTKFLMAGVAAFALMSGPAFAQKLSTETTTTTRSVQTPSTTTIQTPNANVIVADPVPALPPTSTTTTVTKETTDPAVSGDFRATTKKKETRSDGSVTERTRSYTSGADGTKSSASFKSTNPDGSGVKQKNEREVTRNPDGSVSTTNKSTTEVER